MKVIVTGSKGFIGQNMVKELNKEHEVVEFDWLEPYPDVKGCDWVIHLGAISSTTDERIHCIVKQNLEFSIYLYEECIQHGVNFQFASSASVYGLISNFKEDSPVNPKNHYARSKAMFETYIDLRDAPIITQVFRYFNVYGPHEEHKGSQASPHTQFCNQAKVNGTIKLFKGSEKYKRDFIHVSKVVDYHKAFFKVKESGVWNIGSGSTESFQSVANKISKDKGAVVEYIEMPKVLEGNYQKFTKASMSKTNKTLTSPLE